MKKIALLLMAAVLLSVLSGCRVSVEPTTTAHKTTAPVMTTRPLITTQPTTTIGNTSTTETTQILSAVWDSYAQEERFAAYGGTVEHSVADAPGALDMAAIDELTNAYLMPVERLEEVAEAASLVHMMNSNIFTGVVLQPKPTGQLRAFADDWRGVIRENRWICGQPDRLLMLAVDETHLLMAFGSNEAMDTFRTKTAAIYGQSKTLYDEPIVA